VAGSSAPPKGCLFAEPYTKPLVGGFPLPLATRTFYITGTTTAAVVYQDGYLMTPFGSNVVTADANGQFPPIYLDPSVVYKTVLTQGVVLETADPVIQQPPSFASSVLTSSITVSSGSLVSTGLAVTIPQAGTYAFESYLEVVNTSTATGIGINPGNSSQITISSSSANLGTLVGSDNTPRSLYLTLNNILSINSIGVNGFWVRGVFTATAPGIFTMNWGTNGAGGTVRMNAGSYLLVQPVINLGIIFREPQSKPLAAAGSATQTQPGCYRQFYFTGTTTLAPVYADAGLQIPLSQFPGQQLPSTTADGNGRMSVVYLDPSITYATRLFNASGTALQPTVDPVVPRAFEPITAIKTASTVRLTGSAMAPDSALQITLNPGVYAIDSMLEFSPNAGSITVAVELTAVAGAGTVLSAIAQTASSAAYEAVGSGNASGSYAVGSTQTFALGGANSVNMMYSRGSITIINAPVIFALAWSVSGTAGLTAGLNAGSFLQAIQVG